MPTSGLLEALPPLQRLALAYAPQAARPAMLTLLALDARLAGIVRSSHEPMLAQLRLSWWREQLSADPAQRPAGDPLLAALEAWQGKKAALVGLVDGWEAMIGSAPLPRMAFETLAEARGEGFAALAETPLVHAEALRLGRSWALADIASRLSHPDESTAALELAQAQDWRRASLPRGLRPLAVLHGLAAKRIRSGSQREENSPAILLTAIRIGLLGR